MKGLRRDGKVGRREEGGVEGEGKGFGISFQIIFSKTLLNCGEELFGVFAVKC